MEVFLDVLPNHPRNDQMRENFKQILREKFDNTLSEAVERIWELPPIILQKRSREYVGLLVEARDLFIAGYFYSCVAMCGIVGERLIKDAFRTSLLIGKAGSIVSPTDAALDQLERIDVSSIVRFLNEAELLGDEARKAAESLGQLRNQYAHARGKDPHADAVSAITKLHTLVEDTVSVFKDFEITDGGFARKAT
jgi:hypothetical protein